MPIDMTVYQAQMQVRRDSQDQTVLLEMSTANGRITVAADGTLTLAADAATMAALSVERRGRLPVKTS